jgi:3',5'-cyclic AMP phosphodiesterase CpdA
VTVPPLVIAHVSDLHLGADDPLAVRTLAADVAAATPTLTVVTGDCTMRARPSQFRAAAALLDRLPTPRLVVPGNHDVPLSVPARALRPYTRYRAAICADLDPLVRTPGLTALGLNSMPRWRWKNGAVTGTQAGALVDHLGAATPGVRLLALHHPPFATGAARLVGRTRLEHALAAARVDLVLAGHTHVPRSRRVPLAGGHAVVEVVAGTATSRRVRGTPRSWTLIRIDAGTIEVTPREEHAGTWQPTQPTRYPLA